MVRLLSVLVLALVSVSLPRGGFAQSLRRTPVVSAVARTSPAVVSVRVTRMVQARKSPFDWFFNDFGPRRRSTSRTASQGSGVVISPKGYVLTNYHVIAVGGDIQLELTDGRMLEAEVVGAAPDHDLAVLQVKGREKLPFVPMGSSADLMIGETVIAIGNPFGLSHTVTTGVVSAVDRTIQADERTYFDFIQTDASINPGNSGGPLLNLEGTLIGVNTAIYGRAQGIGFAIPIDKARRIVDDLLKYGEVRRPFFGFDTQALTGELAASMGTQSGRGVLVNAVEERSPAAGKLRPGDVIRSVDNHPVNDPSAMRFRLGDYTVGQRARFSVLRDRKPMTIDVKAAALTAAEATQRVTSRVGIEVEALDAGRAKSAGLPAGAVLVTSVARGSPAARYGLQRGDWVRAISSKKVRGQEAFAQAVAESYWRGELLLLIQRGRRYQQLAFPF